MTETHSTPKTGDIAPTPSTPDPSTERGALYVEIHRLTNEVNDLRWQLGRRDYWLRSLHSRVTDGISAYARKQPHALLTDYEHGVETGFKIADEWLDMIAKNCHIEPWG